VRVGGSVEINRPADQVWMYVADYGNDTSWRAGVDQMHPSRPGPAQVGVTTHETLGLLGLTFRTDASIDRVEAGRLLTWHAHDRQKQLRGSRLVADRLGPLPLHRGGGGPSARSVATLEPLVARPPPTSDASNTCWRRRPAADQQRRRRRTEVGPLVNTDNPAHTRDHPASRPPSSPRR
jgi:hypothetical protein